MNAPSCSVFLNKSDEQNIFITILLHKDAEISARQEKGATALLWPEH